jgi:predicted Zn finger-like uncharacterized protein
MSLATRCTACGTIFRIVEDQLRVSDGWVRCGRCAEIFDARELLFDIEREAPPPWPAQYAPAAAVEPEPEPLPTPPPPPPAPPAYTPPPDWMPPPEPEPRAEALPTGWPTSDLGRHESRPEPHWVEDDRVVEPVDEPSPILAREAEPEPSMAEMAPITAEPAERPGKPAKAAKPPKPKKPAKPEPAVPEFMRQAESSARWNRPAVKAALGAASLLLAAVLALQVTLHFRDALAALHPPLREPLRGLCGITGCEIKPWRRIEALSIDATSLSPVGSSSYKLNLSLRNKTGVDVAAPWVELSLTDAAGAPFSRRVLGPEALNPVLTQVNAESEQALSLVFSTGGQKVSGYSVNIFYP